MIRILLRRAACCVLPVVLLAGAACSGGGKKDASTTTSAPTTTSTAPTTTTGPLTKEQIVLAADGVGGVKFGTNAAHTINRFMQALGQPVQNTALPAGQACGATRRLAWANFQVLVNEVTSTAGAIADRLGGMLVAEAASGVKRRHSSSPPGCS